MQEPWKTIVEKIHQKYTETRKFRQPVESVDTVRFVMDKINEYPEYRDLLLASIQPLMIVFDDPPKNMTPWLPAPVPETHNNTRKRVRQFGARPPGRPRKRPVLE